MNVTRYEEVPAVNYTVNTSKGPVRFHAVGEPIVEMPTTDALLARYAASCRNKAKRAYAEKYAAYITDRVKTEPARPASLSFMGAQAVRMQMLAIVRREI